MVSLLGSVGFPRLLEILEKLDLLSTFSSHGKRNIYMSWKINGLTLNFYTDSKIITYPYFEVVGFYKS